MINLAAFACAALVAAAPSHSKNHPPKGKSDPDRTLLPPPAPVEFRAAWLSPVGGGGEGDWPSAPGLPADSQKAELRALLDRAQAIGLNAIILHVRTAGDALYRTPLAPWSAFLTGTSGADPGYDPLAFAVAEAHARGLQLHAWFNPFRAMLPNFVGKAAANHVTRTHPEWIRRYGTQTWIDPGDPAARQAVLDAIVDVARRYDIDGVHLDDYFYPYRESEKVKQKRGRHRVTITRDIAFPDDGTWERFGKAEGWTDRNDWRRDNVNRFVRDMYREVKAVKPWMLVGVSPFGIWRSGTPSGVTGLDAYAEIYADSRLWLAKGWVDYLAPQLYWPLDGAQNRFEALDKWWRTQNPLGRYIWPGLYTVSGNNRWPSGEIASQISAIREWRDGSDDVPGHIHFRLRSLGAGPDGLATALHNGVYAEPALVPEFPWVGAATPGAPSITPDAVEGSYSIAPSDSVPVVWWLVQTEKGDGTWTTTITHASDAPLKIESHRSAAISVRAIGRGGMRGDMSLLGW